MRTTAGLADAATSMMADDSSMVTGWREVTFWPTGEEAGWPCCSKAPVAFSANTVPPEARTAASRAAPTTVPVPAPRRGRSAGTVAVAVGVAGSYQRSWVGCSAGADQAARCAHSERGSGDGE